MNPLVYFVVLLAAVSAQPHGLHQISIVTTEQKSLSVPVGHQSVQYVIAEQKAEAPLQYVLAAEKELPSYQIVQQAEPVQLVQQAQQAVQYVVAEQQKPAALQIVQQQAEPVQYVIAEKQPALQMIQQAEPSIQYVVAAAEKQPSYQIVQQAEPVQLVQQAQQAVQYVVAEQQKPAALQIVQQAQQAVQYVVAEQQKPAALQIVQQQAEPVQYVQLVQQAQQAPVEIMKAAQPAPLQLSLAVAEPAPAAQAVQYVVQQQPAPVMMTPPVIETKVHYEERQAITGYKADTIMKPDLGDKLSSQYNGVGAIRTHLEVTPQVVVQHPTQINVEKYAIEVPVAQAYAQPIPMAVTPQVEVHHFQQQVQMPAVAVQQYAAVAAPTLVHQQTASLSPVQWVGAEVQQIQHQSLPTTLFIQ